MRGIEVGDSTKLSWVPCVQDLAREADSLERVDALGVGAHVHRLGVSVIEVELQAVRHAAPQAELAGVVSAVANAPPCVKGRKLRRVERKRSNFPIDGGAGRITASRRPASHLSWYVDKLQGTGGVPSKPGKHIVHRLRSCYVRWQCARGSAQRTECFAHTTNLSGRGSRSAWEHVFPKGNWSDVLNGNAGVELLGQQSGGREVIHSALGIVHVDRSREILFLEQAVRETADVRRFKHKVIGKLALDGEVHHVR